MNINKAEMKMALAQSWGKRLQEMETDVRRDVARLDGGVEALKKTADALNKSHREYYQKQVEGGQISMAECELCMKVIDRAIGSLQSLLDTATTNHLIKRGELIATQRMADYIEKQYHATRQGLEHAAAALERGEIDVRGRPQIDAAADIANRREQAKGTPAQLPKMPEPRRELARGAR